MLVAVCATICQPALCMTIGLRIAAWTPASGSVIEQLGGAGKVESDDAGGWIVTVTNDIDAANLPIEIPDDFGNVTVDLNGHDLVGGDGDPVIRIVPGHDEGVPTVIAVVNSGEDAMVQGGEGAPAIEVADGAQEGVIINIDAGVTVQGGGIPAIDGVIGENNGNLVKVEVPVPAIDGKEYTGGQLQADISATERYTVQNDGGVDAGNYPVTLTLTDDVNYRWAGGDSNPTTITFTVSKATNARITEPSIAGWTYGDAPSEPSMGAAKFGTATVTYSGVSGALGTERPAEAGDYTATFTVAGTDNYAGLSQSVDFTIEKRSVVVTVTGETATYEYDGTEKRAERFDLSTEDELYDLSAKTYFGAVSWAATRTDAGTSYMGLLSSQFANNDANFDVTYVVSNGWLRITQATNVWIDEPSISGWVYGQTPSVPNMGTAKFGTAAVTYGALGTERPTGPGEYVAVFAVEETGNWSGLTKEVAFKITASEEAKIEESFDGLPVAIAPDGEGGWTVTITNDIDSADLPIEIPDNLGPVTIDLNGHDLIGGDGGFIETALPAIRIVPGEGEGEPTVITVVNSGEDAMMQGGEGAPAIEVADGARDGTIVNVGDGVVVQGGGDGVPAVVGEIGENSGTVVKAAYDMSGARWDYAGAFEYDGKVKTVLVSGLPFGVTVASYAGNTATEPGKYTAHVALAYDEQLYDEPTIPDLKWEIKKPYRLTLRPNSTKYGTVSGGGTYAYGSKATLKAKAKKGYVFAGWFTDKACKKKLNPKGYDNRKATVKYAMPKKNTTIYAKFVTKKADKKALKFTSATAKLAKTPAKATAGAAFSLKLGISSASLPTVTASGLPKGLSVDKTTGEITGMGTVPGAYTAKVTVKSAAGNKITQNVKITVNVPSWAKGDFYGLAYPGVESVGSWATYLKFSVGATGKVSGKVTHKGKAYSFTSAYTSCTAAKATFSPKIEIGPSTFKPGAITVKKAKAGGIAVVEASDKYGFVSAQKKPELVKKGKALAALVGKTFTFTNKTAKSGLTKSRDKLTVMLENGDAVTVTGVVGGKRLSTISWVTLVSDKMAEGGTSVYTLYVDIIDATLKYEKTLVITATVGSGGTKATAAFTK